MPRHAARACVRQPRFLRCVPAVAVTSLAAAVGLAGCTAAPPNGPTPTALPAGVTVELFQLRSDVAERGAQLRVINDSAEDLVITGLTIDDDWFDGPATRERTSTIPAGRTVDLRFALPASACDGEPDAAARTSRVTLELAGGGEVTADLTDPLGFTSLVHEKECLRHDLAKAATLEWTSFTPSTNPQPATLQLGVTPTGATDTARLVDVQTTNLLQFAAEPSPFALGLDIASTTAPETIAVPLVPLRCDPHAVMEDKRGTVFNIAVQIDGASGVVEVAASESLRGEILRWVADWCGFGPG